MSHTTYPGRKDTMETYTAERAPHLAPFDWFGRTYRTVTVRLVGGAR